MPPDDASVEKRVLAAVDAAFAQARDLAGPAMACRPGCDDCCRRPFAITEADASRLRSGLLTLAESTRQEVEGRAAAARAQLAMDFPGDWASGSLTDDQDWREWFFLRHQGLPCPVLDLGGGECRLYHHRPVACRLAGALIQIGNSRTDPCPRCGPTSTYVVIDDAAFHTHRSCRETTIALIL